MSEAANQIKGESGADAIVSAARVLFRDRGYGGTSLQRISDMLDISPKELGKFFKSKLDICLAVVKSYELEMDAQFLRLEETSNSRQRLSLLLDEILEETETSGKGCALAQLFFDLLREEKILVNGASGLLVKRRKWIKEQFRLMAMVDEADDLAYRLAGALEGVCMLALAEDDMLLLKNQFNQLKSWIRSM